MFLIKSEAQYIFSEKHPYRPPHPSINWSLNNESSLKLLISITQLLYAIVVCYSNHSSRKAHLDVLTCISVV